MQPNTQHIAGLLGLAPAPEGLLDWHNRIVEGFPAQSVKALAGATGLAPSVMAAAVGVHPSSKKALSQEASNSLYRVASLWVALQQVFPGKPEAAAQWLTRAHAGMRGRVPLHLVGSSIGFEYAKAAVSREQA